MREGIMRILEQADDIDLVAVCEDVAELGRAVDEKRPDVVITDIRIPPTHTDEGIQLATDPPQDTPGRRRRRAPRARRAGLRPPSSPTRPAGPRPWVTWRRRAAIAERYSEASTWPPPRPATPGPGARSSPSPSSARPPGRRARRRACLRRRPWPAAGLSAGRGRFHRHRIVADISARKSPGNEGAHRRAEYPVSPRAFGLGDS